MNNKKLLITNNLLEMFKLLLIKLLLNLKPSHNFLVIFKILYYSEYLHKVLMLKLIKIY